MERPAAGLTRITCVQLAPVLGDLDANREMTAAAIADAVAAGADVVVLPELATSGYVFGSTDEVDAVAIRPDHPLLAGWAAAAGPAVVVGGFAERGEDGLRYNSAALVDRTGVLAVYRKLHLWDREKLVFAPGDHAPPVVATRVGAVGVLICYDLEFPELTRSVALDGAELLAVPTNWPLSPRPHGERAQGVANATVVARSNRVVVASCDRTGVERGQHWVEGTSIVSDEGWVLASVGAGAGSATADVDLARTRDKTWTPLADAFGDRRPDLYATLRTTPRRQPGAGDPLVTTDR